MWTILCHLKSWHTLQVFKKEFLKYFPEILESNLKLARKPLAVSLKEVCDDRKDELIDLKNDSTNGDMFDTLSICEFWAKMWISYPRVNEEFITKLFPFSSIYLCESGLNR